MISSHIRRQGTTINRPPNANMKIMVTIVRTIRRGDCVWWMEKEGRRIRDRRRKSRGESSLSESEEEPISRAVVDLEGCVDVARWF